MYFSCNRQVSPHVSSPMHLLKMGCTTIKHKCSFGNLIAFDFKHIQQRYRLIGDVLSHSVQNTEWQLSVCMRSDYSHAENLNGSCSWHRQPSYLFCNDTTALTFHSHRNLDTSFQHIQRGPYTYGWRTQGQIHLNFSLPSLGTKEMWLNKEFRIVGVFLMSKQQMMNWKPSVLSKPGASASLLDSQHDRSQL